MFIINSYDTHWRNKLNVSASMPLVYISFFFFSYSLFFFSGGKCNSLNAEFVQYENKKIIQKLNTCVVYKL